jgi:putative Mg2+ transporter-C (MgtC) family protein
MEIAPWVSQLWTASIAPGEALLRLVVALVLCGCLGFERELVGRAAGLRTHMLVGLAAALLTIMAFEMFAWVRSLEERPTADPLRLLEAITAGVAFLAAGSIFREKDRVRGLTTGGGLWMAGAIGIAAGQGLLGLAAMATVLAVIVIAVLRRIEP